jgi:hypothetical protein
MKFIIGILLVLTITGCSFFGKPENQPTAKVLVQYATAKAIKGDTSRALRVKAIATEVQAALKSDEQATVVLISGLIRAKVKWDRLSPEDRALGEYLIQLIEQELTARLGDGILSPDKMLVAVDVLQWVIDATEYGGAA